MATIFDVAKYILGRERMTTWKLQKLCYYSQAWHLAWTGEPLFDNDFLAWRNGPVCMELYNECKEKFWISENELTKGDKDALNEDQIESISIVLEEYGKRDPYDLTGQVRSEEPWQKAWNIMCGDKSDNIITKESMTNYYRSL